ncbi:MAG: hypothetical protein QG635_1110, partial [Bacteroidota bacterium]|nr:hypothetical protein [Bacteroidota bacterium]
DSAFFEVTIFPKDEGLNISGMTSVCEGDTAKYAAIAKSDVINQWYCSDGTNINILDEFTVEILWDKPGSRNVKLVQENTLLHTKDSVEIIVEVYPKPNKPLITRNGVHLVSSADFGNQWLSEGAAIQDAIYRYYKPAKNGNYYVFVVDSNGCVSDTSDKYYFEVTGVDENENNELIRIFPNPASDVLYISILNPEQKKLSVEIIDELGGRSYFSQNYQISNNFNETIGLDKFASGIYFIRFRLGEITITRKLIIIKK